MSQRKRRRVVIKLGSNVVIDSNGQFAKERLGKLLRPLAKHVSAGVEIILVSSGAVALGRGLLNQKKRAVKNSERQALASLGQSHLMLNYEKIFAKEKQKVAQVLLTREDLSDRMTYNNLRHTLDQLVDWKILPVLNENDSVSILELTETSGGFGDNDKLSALVAVKMEADLLILLSDVDGVYDKNPRKHKDAAVIKRLGSEEDFSRIQIEGHSETGRGGMASKLQAARVAAWSGVPVIIANGLQPKTLANIFSDLSKKMEISTGTYFTPRKILQKKKHWIGFSSGVFGYLKVNAGAAKALIDGKRSLLPVGVTEVSGDFERMQVVSVVDEGNKELGRGISFFSSKELNKVKGLQSREALKLVENPEDDVVIQRDNFVALIEQQEKISENE